MPLKKHEKKVFPIMSEKEFEQRIPEIEKKLAGTITMLDIAKECVRDKYKAYAWDAPMSPEEYCICNGVDPDAVRKGLI